MDWPTETRRWRIFYDRRRRRAFINRLRLVSARLTFKPTATPTARRLFHVRRNFRSFPLRPPPTTRNSNRPGHLKTFRRRPASRADEKPFREHGRIRGRRFISPLLPLSVRRVSKIAIERPNRRVGTIKKKKGTVYV